MMANRTINIGEISELDSSLKGTIIPGGSNNIIKYDGTFKFKWILNNVQLYCEPKKSCVSPTFTTFVNCQSYEINWNLELYPCSNSVCNSSYMGVFLKCLSSNKTKRVKTSCELKLSIAPNRVAKTYFVHEFINDIGFGCPKLFQKNNFDPSKGDVLITIECSIHTSVPNDELAISDVLQNYQNLYQNKKFSDVCIVTNKGENYAHKNILSSQSMLLAEVLDKKESNGQEIMKLEMKDTSGDVIEELLKYMYCVQVSNVSIGLFIAAHKFKMQGLKNLCEEVISKTLSLENAIDALVTGDDYNAVNLKNAAIKFIFKNYEHFLKPPFSQHMEKLNCRIYTELLHKALAKEGINSRMESITESPSKKPKYN